MPFQWTVVPEAVKAVPFTVKVNGLPPAVAELGLRLLIVGRVVFPETDPFEPPDPPELLVPPEPHPGSSEKENIKNRVQMKTWVNSLPGI